MEAIFYSTPKGGRNVWKNHADVEKYLLENEGKELIWEVDQSVKYTDKQKMFAYLFGPLTSYAIRAYTSIGWSGEDKTSIRYRLQAEFAKEDKYNEETGEVMTYPIDLSKMNKERLLKFLQDSIFFLEEKFGQEVPDSQEYKMMKLTGKALKTTKYDK